MAHNGPDIPTPDDVAGDLPDPLGLFDDTSGPGPADPLGLFDDMDGGPLDNDFDPFDGGY